MFFRKPKTTIAPVEPRHDLTIKLPPGFEIHASGRGLIVAPIVLLIVFMILALMAIPMTRIGRLASGIINPDRSAASIEKPPPQA